MKHLLLIALSLATLRATIVDRIAITVGRQVITEMQIDEDLRVTALLNHQPIGRDTEARRSAADRLVAQLIIKREMELSHYPLPDTVEVAAYLKKVQDEFHSDSEYQQALAAYNVSEDVLRDHLTLQLMTLQFVEFRFRPDTDISDADMQAYYEQAMAKWKAEHPGAVPPTLSASRDSIRKSLIDQRTGEILNTWLAEKRKQIEIVYLDKSLE